MGKNLVVALLILASVSASLSAKWIEKGEAAPFAGDLRTKKETVEDLALFKQFEANLVALEECRTILDAERERSNRFYRRPSFWVPVARVTFTVGLLVGFGGR